MWLWRVSVYSEYSIDVFIFGSEYGDGEEGKIITFCYLASSHGLILVCKW